MKEALLHQEAMETIRSFALQHHLIAKEIVTSPILGPKGNKEFLIHLVGDKSEIT